MDAHLKARARGGAIELHHTRTPWWYQKWGQILPSPRLQLRVQRAWRNATEANPGFAHIRFAKARDGRGYEPE